MRYYHITDFGSSEKATLISGALLSMMMPIIILGIIVFFFIVIDFGSGIAVSMKYKKEGLRSTKMYNTVWKLIGAEVCVLMAWLLDTYVFDFMPVLFFPNIFAGIICTADLISILANFAILSDDNVFRVAIFLKT